MAQDNHVMVSELIARLLEQQLEIDPIQAQHILEATNNDIELAIRLYIEDAFVQRHQMLAADADRDLQDQPHADENENLNANHLHNPQVEPVPPNAPPRRRNRNAPYAPPFEDQAPNLALRDADDSSHSSNGSNVNPNENIGRGNQVVNQGGNENANVSIQDYASISDEDDHSIYDKYLKRVKLHYEQKYCSRNLNSNSVMNRKNTIKQREIFVQCMDQLKDPSGGNEDIKASKVLEQLMTLSKKIDHGQQDERKENDTSVRHRDLVSCPSDYDIHSTSSGMNGDSSDDHYYIQFKKDSTDELLREGLNLLSSDVSDPSRVLWGGCHEHEHSKDTDESSAPKIEESFPNSLQSTNEHNNNLGESTNSLKNGEDPLGDSKLDSNSEFSGDDGLSETVKIPRTWLAAGFSLSPCGTGLALNKPCETELARLKSIQPTLFPSGTTSLPPPLPPFHCGGVTQLTSLVTALLYSGACLQGKTVRCVDVDKKPFDSLTLDEKKKEFPSRLTEALTAILWIASESGRENRSNVIACVQQRYSRKRKKRKFPQEAGTPADSTVLDHQEKCTNQNTDHDGGVEQLIANRLKLCPVCRWDSSGAQTTSTWNPLDEEKLSTSVSFTNPNDLRAFVVSSLRNFMGVGGIALFLETLVHIHGLKNIKRMLSELRNKTKDGNIHIASLISCNCEEKLQTQWTDYVSKRTAMGSEKSIDWSSPVGHECAGPELMSLLLTGSPHDNFEDWSAEMFGIGFLSGGKTNRKGMINPRLMQPCKPIWIVQGKQSYFVIWKKSSEGKNYNSKTIEDESSSFVISSWNSWPNSATKNSDVRIIPARKECAPRIPFASLSSSDDTRSVDDFISEDEISNTKSHPDDMIHYDDFHRWRYQVPSIESKNSSENTSDKNWIPFFRLNPHQKEIVRRKYSSCRDIAIWSLWPGASIDDRVGKSCITKK